MKITLCSLAGAVCLAFSGVSFGAEAKDYQVTGPVLEVTSSMIAVQKGKDRWELGRDSNTKASAEPKVGDKVTVHYSMTATNIEVKAGKSEKAKTAASPAASPKK